MAEVHQPLYAIDKYAPGMIISFADIAYFHADKPQPNGTVYTVVKYNSLSITKPGLTVDDLIEDMEESLSSKCIKVTDTVNPTLHDLYLPFHNITYIKPVSSGTQVNLIGNYSFIVPETMAYFQDIGLFISVTEKGTNTPILLGRHIVQINFKNGSWRVSFSNGTIIIINEDYEYLKTQIPD